MVKIATMIGDSRILTMLQVPFLLGLIPVVSGKAILCSSLGSKLTLRLPYQFSDVRMGRRN